MWRRFSCGGIALLLVGILLAAAWPSDLNCHEHETHHEACPALHCCGLSHTPLISPAPGAIVYRTETIDDLVRHESIVADRLIISPPFQPPRA